MRHHIRAVLFDLDGVVVDTTPYHYRAWRRLADEQGWTLEEHLARSITGVPRSECLDIILELNGVEADEGSRRAFASRKNAYLVEQLCEINEHDIRPGVLQFLNQLKLRGVTLGLYSLSASAAVVAERLELDEWFDAVVTGSDIRYTDWNAGIFEECARKLHVPPFHCIAIESSPRGVKAALESGIKVLGVGDAAQHAGAREIVDDFGDVDVDFLLDSGRTTRFPEEPWHISETVLRPGRARYWETLFALSNGLLGLRAAHEEEDPVLDAHSYPGMFMNGVYGYLPYRHVVSFPGFPERLHVMHNLVDWRIVNLRVDGERFSLFGEGVTEYRRALDMRRGIVERSVVWRTAAGRRVRLRSTRLVSMKRRHCAALRYEVTPLDGPVEIALESKIVGSAVSEELGTGQTQVIDAAPGRDSLSLHVRSATSEIGVGVAVVERLSNGGGARTTSFAEEQPATYARTITVRADAGQSIVLDRYAAFYSSIEVDAAAVVMRAGSDAVSAADDGFERVLEEQAAYWQRYWDTADIEIGGAVGEQQALRFNLFHLRQSHPEDDRRSIGANGMTGDKYRGHVFWDTEMYMVPPFVYTEPEIVRPLLMYRYNLLERARERARELDGVGALYAWNSISGEECGVVFEASTAQYHLLPAIAHAIYRYHEATGDDEFLFRYGAEILFETSRFLEDRGARIPHKNNAFCLNVVCGPDEYGCGVNNNCYTNVMAQWHLRYAATVHDRMSREAPELLGEVCARIALGKEEPAAWRDAADAMYVPFNEALGMHEQDDGYLSLDPVDMTMVPRNTDIREITHPLNLWRMQVSKQADVVLLMFVQGHQFPLDVKLRNYEFYEPRTCHGSSLSACIHAIVAAELGKHEEAYDYYREGLMMDLNDFKDNTGGGVHSACLGGAWMTVVNGFAGMRDYPDGLSFNPWLPPAWDSYRFKVCYRGSRIGVEVDSDGAAYRLLDGNPVSFKASGRTVELRGDKPVRVAAPQAAQ